jgi:hypothetical protein
MFHPHPDIPSTSLILGRQWNQWLQDHQGPVWTYMAPCNGDCANLNLALDQGGQNVKWFKIDAKGYDTSAKRWASDDVIAGTTLSIEMSLGLVIYG